jgi:protein TonB
MEGRVRSAFGGFVRFVIGALGALVATAALFLVLPVLQAISATPPADLVVVKMEQAADEPPPPPPMEEEKQEEAKPEEKPPELAEEEPQQLDLSQMELALNPGSGGDGGGDFVARLTAAPQAAVAEQKDVDALFSLGDLDQKPRVVYQPAPTLSAEAKRKAPGSVYVLFVVDQNGRVENPTVQSASDPVFERPALAAVKQWKFEPGRRKGQPVRFRMRVPITFPQG